MFLKLRNAVLALLAGVSVAAALVAPVAAAEPSAIRIGYGYATPSMLVLKETGWLEKRLAGKGIAVEWILSRGSNQTLEFLRGGSIDFGSSAGSAALLGHANGTPNKLIAILTRGESTALLTLPGSGIASLNDLRGKKVAATRGTEPYIFLLRALQKAGIPAKDVEVVALQHPQGRLALETKQVDAWAALDPDFAITELQKGSTVFYRDQSLITGGVLNVHTGFAAKYPDLVKLVAEGTVWASRYVNEHHDEALALYAKAGGLEPAIALKAFDRNNQDELAITEDDVRNIAESGLILKETGAIPANTDLEAATRDLLDPQYIKAALGQ